MTDKKRVPIMEMHVTDDKSRAAQSGGLGGLVLRRPSLITE